MPSSYEDLPQNSKPHPPANLLIIHIVLLMLIWVAVVVAVVAGPPQFGDLPIGGMRDFAASELDELCSRHSALQVTGCFRVKTVSRYVPVVILALTLVEVAWWGHAMCLPVDRECRRLDIRPLQRDFAIFILAIVLCRAHFGVQILCASTSRTGVPATVLQAFCVQIVFSPREPAWCPGTSRTASSSFAVGYAGSTVFVVVALH